MESDLDRLVSQLSSAPSSETYEEFASLVRPKDKNNANNKPIGLAIMQMLPQITDLMRRDVTAKGDAKLYG